MADKIRNGQVPGVKDPAAARDMVVKGNCTYNEARNIAKAGNIDSIKFDAKTQAVTCGLICGMSFLLTYVNSVRDGKTHKEALKEASSQAAKVGYRYDCGGWHSVIAKHRCRSWYGRFCNTCITYCG